MLKTDRERRICEKYSAFDETGHVHCNECPLRVNSIYSDCACRATMHYNKNMREWMPDEDDNPFVSDKGAVEAARTLMRYCEQHPYDLQKNTCNCQFMGKNGSCRLIGVPCGWKLNRRTIV